MNQFTINLESVSSFVSLFGGNDIKVAVIEWFKENGVETPDEYLVDTAMNGLREEGYLQKEKNC